MNWSNLGLAAATVLAFSAQPAFAMAPRPSHPSVPAAERLSLAHSHNDYEQPHPLWDALSNKMDSVEADVWYKDGRLTISHWGSDPKGTLEDLYLDPLAKILSTQNSVYGDGKVFYLWVEIKDSDEQVLPILYDTLNRYSFITQFTDTSIRQGAVTVVLTGDRDNKKKFTEMYSVRPAVRDYDWVSEKDPQVDNRWQWYAINYFDYFKWGGYGQIPYEDELELEILTQMVHSKGRKLRIYGTPEEEDLWNQFLVYKVDMIGTDKPGRLHKFITAP